MRCAILTDLRRRRHEYKIKTSIVGREATRGSATTSVVGTRVAGREYRRLRAGGVGARPTDRGSCPGADCRMVTNAVLAGLLLVLASTGVSAQQVGNLTG